MKYKVQEMMSESNANEEAIAKWTAEPNEKLEKLEEPMADIEKVIKNWDRRKSIEEKKQEKQRFERRIGEEKQTEEMRQELQTQVKKGKDGNKDPRGKLSKLVSQLSVHTYRF